MSVALALALLGGVLLLVIALVWRAVWAGYAEADPRIPSLSAKEQATIAAASTAFFPGGGRLRPSGTEAGLVAYVGRYLGRLPGPTRRLVRLLFAFVEHAPWLLGPRLARLSRLDPGERVTMFAAMAKSRVYLFRAAFTSLRTLLAMGYLAHAPVARAIGCGADDGDCEGGAERGGPAEGSGDEVDDGAPSKSGERLVVRVGPASARPARPDPPENAEVA